jgi:cell division septation protein DedD
LKTVVILLAVLNLLAAFFLMPVGNGISGVSSSPEMSASGLALLSEVEIELKAPVVENVAPITVVESTPVVEEIVSTDAVAAQKTLESNESVPALSVVTLRNPELILKEKPAFQCSAIQGIKTIDAANQLKTKLAELKAKNFVISTSDEVSNKYWVYLGPYRTKQEAIDANKKLRERNRGGYFFTNDEVKNGISLGVFSSAVNAQRLQAKLNGQGYRTKTWRQQLSLFVLTADIPVEDLLKVNAVADDDYLIQSCDN